MIKDAADGAKPASIKLCIHYMWETKHQPGDLQYVLQRPAGGRDWHTKGSHKSQRVGASRVAALTRSQAPTASRLNFVTYDPFSFFLFAHRWYGSLNLTAGATPKRSCM